MMKHKRKMWAIQTVLRRRRIHNNTPETQTQCDSMMCHDLFAVLTALSDPVQMADDSIYNRSQTRAFPFPPLLPLSHDTETSELYQVGERRVDPLSPAPSSQTKSLLIPQMVLRHSRYPPILRTDTRTLAAPFKEQHTHRSSCQSVGNNYSPLAQDLKMFQLQQRPLTVTPAAALRILPT